MIRKISIILFFLSSILSYAQLQNIKGLVVAKGEVEGVHVLNKSSVKYTVTDTDGSFDIPVKLNDTLVFSALKYKIKEVIINSSILTKTFLTVNLEEKINELDEVVVGKILTGNIGSDIGNLDIKEDVNFYDLGIPGYTGKPKTIPERKLADADAGNWGYIGLGFGVNVHKLLNRISGRTKKLKAIVDIDERDRCMKRMKRFYSESLFENEELTQAQQAEYFYFCMDDAVFKVTCERNNPTEVIPFLNKKLKAYKENLQSKDD